MGQKSRAGFLESLRSFLRMDWDHEPDWTRASPSPLFALIPCSSAATIVVADDTGRHKCAEPGQRTRPAYGGKLRALTCEVV